MRRLLVVELRRLVARTATPVLVLLAIASTLMLGWSAYEAAKPLSPAELEQAEQGWELAQQDWAENGPEMVEQCLEAQETDSELQGEELDYGCGEMEPQREWYFPPAVTFEDLLPRMLGSGLLMLSLIALLLGITLVAAEFATGSIGTWLTFEPRRGRVFASKVAAVAIGGGVVGLLWSGALLLSMVGAFALAGAEATVRGSVVAMLLRTAVLAVAVAVIGAGLAFIVRHTAAALGVAVGYLVGVDLMLGNMVPGLARWSVTTNLSAWAQGSATYYTTECRTEADGTYCEGVEHTVSMTQGGLVLLALVAIVTAVALITFRYRDV